MAKIAFLIDRLPPHTDPIAEFAYDLVCGLADQNHEIRLLSTYRPDEVLPAPHPRIEFLRPFRTWSALELIKILPLLIDYKPDIIHILQPRAEAARGFTSALNFLPSLSPFLKSRLVTTVFEIEATDRKVLKWIIASSHAITAATPSQLELTRKMAGRRQRPPLFELLPISSSVVRTSSRQSHIPHGLESFFARGEHVVVVPGDVSHHDPEILSQLESVLRDLPQSHLLLAGGWGATTIHERHQYAQRWDSLSIGNRILVSGPLSLDSERWCLSRAAVAVLAGMSMESSQLARLIREAMHAAAPMILTEAQLRQSKLSFVSGENCVAVSALSAVGKATREVLLNPEARERIRAQLGQTSNIQVVDLPANVMNRMYARLLEGY